MHALVAGSPVRGVDEALMNLRGFLECGAIRGPVKLPVDFEVLEDEPRAVSGPHGYRKTWVLGGFTGSEMVRLRGTEVREDAEGEYDPKEDEDTHFDEDEREDMCQRRSW